MAQDQEFQRIREQLAGLKSPAELKVFVSAACPHCKQAVESAGSVARASSVVNVTVIDAQLHPEQAQRYSVQSVPVTVLDDGLTWIGAESAQEIARRILSRSASDHDVEVFRSLVETGRHADAVDRVLSGAGAAHLAAIWIRSTTSSRIGLMLIAEGVLEQNPQALHAVVDDLTPALTADDAALRGDTADLLGQIGHPRGLEALRPLLDDPNPDVAEIAAEALGLDED
jgi:thioredoxin-like negative regulator of GroEL